MKTSRRLLGKKGIKYNMIVRNYMRQKIIFLILPQLCTIPRVSSYNY